MLVRDLLAMAAFDDAVRFTPGPPDAVAHTVEVVEDLESLEHCPPGAVVVLTGAAAATIRRFRLDALMSRAVHAGAAMVVLPVDVQQLPRPSRELAERVCVVAVDPHLRLGGLLVALSRSLAGQDSGAVRVLDDGLARLEAADLAGDPEGVLLAALDEEGVPAQLTSALGESTETSVAADAGRHWVAGRSAQAPTVQRLLLHVANSLLLAAHEEASLPGRSVAALIAEVLSTEDHLTPELRRRCRTVGFLPEGWHLVLAVDTVVSGDPRHRDQDEQGQRQLRLEEAVRRTIAPRLAEESHAWTWALRGSSLLFVRTWAREPSADQVERVHESCRQALADVRSLRRAADLEVAAGRSAPHAHLAGLRRAVSEARTAMTAQRAEVGSPRSEVAVFDQFGLDRVLLGWYLSDGASSAAAELLSPITSLPRSKAQPLLLTLRAYLDHQGSISLTAEALYLHRNAVRQRVNRIKELLGSDLADPDERLSLHLACRGLQLASGRS